MGNIFCNNCLFIDDEYLVPKIHLSFHLNMCPFSCIFMSFNTTKNIVLQQQTDMDKTNCLYFQTGFFFFVFATAGKMIPFNLFRQGESYKSWQNMK